MLLTCKSKALSFYLFKNWKQMTKFFSNFLYEMRLENKIRITNKTKFYIYMKNFCSFHSHWWVEIYEGSLSKKSYSWNQKIKNYLISYRNHHYPTKGFNVGEKSVCC